MVVVALLLRLALSPAPAPSPFALFASDMPLFSVVGFWSDGADDVTSMRSFWLSDDDTTALNGEGCRCLGSGSLVADKEFRDGSSATRFMVCSRRGEKLRAESFAERRVRGVACCPAATAIVRGNQENSQNPIIQQVQRYTATETRTRFEPRELSRPIEVAPNEHPLRESLETKKKQRGEKTRPTDNKAGALLR